MEIPDLTEEEKGRFLSKFTPEPNSGCWLWDAGCYWTGYGGFSIKHRNYPAHRISFVLHGGKLTREKPHILHSCHTRLCVNPKHLRAGTPQDNVDDMVAANRQAKGDRQGLRLHPGTAVRGERHHNSVLSETDVREIRQLAAEKISTKQIAARFNVHKGTIMRVIRRLGWQHVS